MSQSHSDEVDTPGDVVPPSEEEGEQSRDGETTHPTKKHSPKLSLTSQIPKRSPTKKKKQGSARHLEQSGSSGHTSATTLPRSWTVSKKEEIPRC